MKKILTTLATFTMIVFGSGSLWQPATARQAPTPRIEVAFVLDTTGSMSGLIEGAKVKIWSIANQMIQAKPTPELSIGLVAYRDRGDDYVTEIHDLSPDIDGVYAALQTFHADGGGDTPESVNQALHEAVSKLSWSPDEQVLKIIFLVGDCPPHMDYSEVQYPESCRRAVTEGLIINTVQCGSHAETTPIWKKIARLSEGQYVAIGQSGDMQVIDTPMDEELARLNVTIGQTLVAYGSRRARQEVAAKQRVAEGAAAPSVADRLAYNAATGKTVQGGGDLLDAIESGQVTLSELESAELPEVLRGKDETAQIAWLENQKSKRSEIQARIDTLLSQRREYLAAEQARLARAGKGGGFDQQIAQMLRSQALRKGIVLAP